MTANLLHAQAPFRALHQFNLRALAALTGIFGRPSCRELESEWPVSMLTTAEAAELDAAKVRDLAHSYSKTDPAFAADLYAAAERHEKLYGE